MVQLDVFQMVHFDVFQMVQFSVLQSVQFDVFQMVQFGVLHLRWKPLPEITKMAIITHSQFPDGSV